MRKPTKSVLMRATLCAGLALPAAAAWAQNVPPGWQVVKVGFKPFPGEPAPESSGSCQIAVPPDWKRFILPNMMTAPDPQKGSATVTASKPGLTFAREVKIAKDNQKVRPVEGLTVIEDSASRYWTEAQYLGETHWDVTAPGNPNCNLQLSFATDVQKATARQIVMTLAPAK